MKILLSNLHFRMGLWLLVLLGAVWLAIWANNRSQIEESARRDVDRRLQESASLVLQLHYLQNNTAPPDESALRNVIGSPDEPADTRTPVTPAFEIRTGTRVLLSSGDFPLAEAPGAPGFESRDVDGRRWRLYTRLDGERGLTIRVALDQREQDASEAALRRDFDSPLLWLLPLLALAALISIRQGLAPLRTLAARLDRLDPGDPQPLDLDRRRVPGELRPLVGTLDRLLLQMRDIYARQRAFTASAAHELRTPLAGCLAQLSIARHAPNASARERAFGRMHESIEHMTQLIRRMLMLARLDRAGSALERQPVALGTLIEEVAAQYQAAAAEAGISLDVHIARALTIKGEPSLLHALVANPLENALDVSPPGTTVAISLDRQGATAQITLSDEGPGIPLALQERVFDPFYQGDPGDDTTRRGSGLGLAITRAIVEAHDGTIEIRKGVARGTVIDIHLPADEPDPSTQNG